MDELLRDLAPPVVGLLVAAIGLLYARAIRRQAERVRKVRAGEARPAE